jgi:hypothetical protein
MEIARHRIDAAIWCTFSTQAWKESERTVWLRLPPAIRARTLLAVTNKDLLRADQAAKVMARLAKLSGADFRGIELISSVKAQKALGEAGEVEDAALWQGSGAGGLLEALGALLADIRRERLKRVQGFAARVAASGLDRLAGPIRQS